MNAPRLTSKVMDDVALAVEELDASIEYLETSIPRYEAKSQVRIKLTDKYNSLIRARNWIAGKIEAERAKREPGEGI